MDCPKCGKQMKSGYLLGFQSGAGAYWLPKEKRPKRASLLFDTKESVEEKGGVMVHEPVLFMMLQLEAEMCPDCKCGYFEQVPGDREK